MRQYFNIPRSGGVEMQGNIMKSDGSNENDLRAVNVESMSKFLGCPTDSFENLYNQTIEKINLEILDKETKALEEARVLNSLHRVQEVDQIVESLLLTINNLPMEAKMRLYVAITPPKALIEDNVKESTSTEEVKEAGDKPGAESPRKRGRPSKIAS